MDHKWLEDFLMLARGRYFSNAAALRHVTLPQFSRRIRALELWAGAELINRSGVPISLTPAGETLLAGSKLAVNALADARDRVARLGGAGVWTTLFTGRTLSRTVVPMLLAKVRKQLGEVPVRLTATEAQLMRVFAAQPGVPISRERLVTETGGEDAAQERAVDVQITRLRRKIEDDPKVPRYLQTVRGEGYMLQPD